MEQEERTSTSMPTARADSSRLVAVGFGCGVGAGVVFDGDTLLDKWTEDIPTERLLSASSGLTVAVSLPPFELLVLLVGGRRIRDMGN